MTKCHFTISYDSSELQDQLFSEGFLIGCVIPPHSHKCVSLLFKAGFTPMALPTACETPRVTSIHSSKNVHVRHSESKSK